MAIPSSKVPLEDFTTPLAPPNIGCPLWAFIVGVDMKTSASRMIGQIAPHRADDNLFISPPSVDQVCRKSEGRVSNIPARDYPQSWRRHRKVRAYHRARAELCQQVPYPTAHRQASKSAPE